MECCCAKKHESLSHELHEAREGIAKGMSQKPSIDASAPGKIVQGASSSLRSLRKF